MPSSKIYFLKFTTPQKIENVLSKIGVWSDLVLHKGDKTYKIQSLRRQGSDFCVTFNALNPAPGESWIRFNMENQAFQIDGLLDAQFNFTVKDFSEELKRRITRTEIPEDQPATFFVQQAGGQDLKTEARLKDIHTDGFLFHSAQPISIKAGDRIQGLIRIQPFHEVQVGGIIRHCLKKDQQVIAGIEIYHLEFGSEEKMNDLMKHFISVAPDPQIR